MASKYIRRLHRVAPSSSQNNAAGSGATKPKTPKTIRAPKIVAPSTTPPPQAATKAQSPKYIRRHHKRVMKVYKQESPSSTTKAPSLRRTTKNLSPVPVFMLPHGRYLKSIPEEAAVHEGFCLKVSREEQPKEEERPKIRFSGLMSLSHPNKPAIERSATTAIEFQSFAWSDIPIARPPIVARPPLGKPRITGALAA